MLVGAEVTKRFGALTVLDGVNFALAAKEAVGIVGPNGAGETTLLNVLPEPIRLRRELSHSMASTSPRVMPRNVVGLALPALTNSATLRRHDCF